MEPIIENITEDTYKQMLEMVQYLHRKAKSWLIALVAGIVFLVLGLFMRNQTVILCGLAECGCYVWFRLRPRRVARKIYNNRLAYYDNTMPPGTFRFYEDHFTFSDVDSWHRVPYEKIKAAVKLKSCIVLEIADNRSFMLSSDGFRKGSQEEVWQLLRRQCPHINPAQWQW